MVHINLLPVRQIKQKAAAKNQLVAFFLILMLLLGGLGVIGFFQMSQATALKNDIADLKKEKQRHAATLRLIKQLEKDKALIETRIGIIKKLKQSSSLTVHALDETANLIPVNRLWLTTLTQSGSNMQLSGMALDNRTIAKFMEDLKTSPYISGVNLQSSSLKSFAGRNLKAFSLSCTITVPDTEEEKSIDNTQQPK
jgi:type IV pilus assembly protein PilN